MLRRVSFGCFSTLLLLSLSDSEVVRHCIRARSIVGRSNGILPANWHHRLSELIDSSGNASVEPDPSDCPPLLPDEFRV